MRSLPKVQTLKEAVRAVIESNKGNGYHPTRFIQATANGDRPDLPSVCYRLIVKGETLEYLESALRQFPTLLALEDFVSENGVTWGFSQDTIKSARACAEYFDMTAGATRYK